MCGNLFLDSLQIYIYLLYALTERTTFMHVTTIELQHNNMGIGLIYKAPFDIQI